MNHSGEFLFDGGRRNIFEAVEAFGAGALPAGLARPVDFERVFSLTVGAVSKVFTVSFMHAVALGTRIFTDAKILHDGHQIMICECGIVDAAGNLYAKAHATFFVIEALES